MVRLLKVVIESPRRLCISIKRTVHGILGPCFPYSEGFMSWTRFDVARVYRSNLFQMFQRPFVAHVAGV